MLKSRPSTSRDAMNGNLSMRFPPSLLFLWLWSGRRVTIELHRNCFTKSCFKTLNTRDASTPGSRVSLGLRSLVTSSPVHYGAKWDELPYSCTAVKPTLTGCCSHRIKTGSAELGFCFRILDGPAHFLWRHLLSKNCWWCQMQSIQIRLKGWFHKRGVTPHSTQMSVFCYVEIQGHSHRDEAILFILFRISLSRYFHLVVCGLKKKKKKSKSLRADGGLRVFPKTKWLVTLVNSVTAADLQHCLFDCELQTGWDIGWTCFQTLVRLTWSCQLNSDVDQSFPWRSLTRSFSNRKSCVIYGFPIFYSPNSQY